MEQPTPPSTTTSPTNTTPRRRRPSRAPHAPSTATDNSWSAVFTPEDFPGCEPFHLPAAELERYEGRLEIWDGRTRTAWKVCEPTSTWHEAPARMLTQVAREVALWRGSRIKSFGSADLVRRDPAGRTRWLMQADEVLYLHPDRRCPYGPAIDVEAHPLPDVVLEVDHTTDVRRRKLALYHEAGFDEVWVLVPPQSPVNAPGVTIHVRAGGACDVDPASNELRMTSTAPTARETGHSSAMRAFSRSVSTVEDAPR